jgi:2-aminoadipate transaminase
MQWTCHFAERTKLMRRSCVREFVKVASRPGMIAFAGGLPASELLPNDAIREAADVVLRREGSRALQYGPSEGIPELREWIANEASKHGTAVRPENVAIVSGSQQALDLLGRVLLDTGARVAVESPTYLAALSAWRPLAVEFCAVELEPKPLLRGSRDGLDLLYVVPNFQNPRGTTLSLQARRELVKFAQDLNLPIIEDNPYGELRYDGAPLPNLFDLAGGVQGPVIYTSTFSKVLAPALRLGVVIAHEDVIDRVVQAKQAADLQTGGFTQLLALELVRNGFLQTNIPRLRDVYELRRDTMLKALSKHMPPDVTWTKPEGGMFIMLYLPAEIDAAEIAQEAIKHNVAIVPGTEFHIDGSGRNTARLNFTFPNQGQIEEGIETLAGVIQSQCHQPAQR